MTNIHKVSQNVQQFATNFIPKALHRRFRTGIIAFGLTEFQSVNGNGRRLHTNRYTGETRTRRAAHDDRFPKLLLHLLVKVYLPRDGWLKISLDHSKFGRFNVAVLALSVGQGRSLPIWCVVTRYHKQPFLKPLLRGLAQLFDELSQSQKRHTILVMDRWFGIPDLLNWLDDEKIYFIVRMKQGIGVGVPHECLHCLMPIGEISLEDCPVTYAGRDYRLVRSNVKPGMKEDEPWFLLTNPLKDTFTRQQVLRAYAHRFELEDSFKDQKWLQRLGWQQIKQREVMTTVLMFVFTGWWVLHDQLAVIVRKARTRHQHPKKKLSWVRLVWEYWQRLCTAPLLAIASG